MKVTLNDSALKSETIAGAPPIGIRPGVPALALAPMEGVTDAAMRSYLTQKGGYAFCVSEFLRISHHLLPDAVFKRHVPESAHGWVTPSGTPISLQLLGGVPELVAQSAAQGARLGAPAIDLNFGCPAPTVNRSDGGATLLRYPHRIRAIVEAVRRAVPPEIPVSAKLRLGWEDQKPIHLNAEMAAQGGANWITIHGRTKEQGYRPPAYWGPIGEVRRALAPLPVIANGDLWTLGDLERCREETGCEHFMLGRSALADPGLARRWQAQIQATPASERAWDGEWERWVPELKLFREHCRPYAWGPTYVPRRIKQWVKLASLRYAVPWFERLKLVQAELEFDTWFQ